MVAAIPFLRDADLASSNVEINSVFIDQGFEALDLKTLNQTLYVLEKLESEFSQTIGFINHIDSLKERISTQIQLDGMLSTVHFA